MWQEHCESGAFPGIGSNSDMAVVYLYNFFADR